MKNTLVKGIPAVRALTLLFAVSPLGIALLPGAAWAEAHAITVVNHAAGTIRSIQIAPAGAASFGANRLRSQLPPNAEARIGYGTGCPADLRLGFDDGRIEDHLGLDACSNPHVLTGSNAAVAANLAPSRAATPKRQTAASATQAAPVAVPPWSGRSITKRFGGLD
jgi:hypothetical protein